MSSDAPDRWTVILDKIGIPVRVVAHVLIIIAILFIGFSTTPKRSVGEISLSQLTRSHLCRKDYEDGQDGPRLPSAARTACPNDR